MTQRNVQLPSDHPRLQVGLAVAALLAIVPTLAVELSGSPLNVFEVKGYLVFHNVCEFFSIRSISLWQNGSASSAGALFFFAISGVE